MNATQKHCAAEAHLAELLQGDVTSEQILSMEFTEPKWVIPGLLPEGLTILAGRPKSGKSWLALQIAVALSIGGEVLGAQVERSEVAYFALEDSERRLRKRMDTLQAVASKLLFLRPKWTKGEAALSDLRLWLSFHGKCRCVIIDTLARIREPSGDDKYQEDNDFIAALRTIAEGRKLAIVLVHHTRKAIAEDFIDAVLGTSGLAGSADSVWVLARPRKKPEGTLSVTGRDIEERELAVRFDIETGWSVLGDADEHRMTVERQEIVECLKGAPAPMQPREIADIIERPVGSIRHALLNLEKDGHITRVGYGKYKA